MDRLMFVAVAAFGLGAVLFSLGFGRVMGRSGRFRAGWARGIFLAVGGLLVATGVLGAVGLVR